ncbi:ABC transporter permease [Sphaerisporangium melleum]|uniref:ABC transporter permease n=1 Tax=Sphaerisporangium melleum TaxID=321316 RepID=A0A917R776_9ACTN|nr:sugar ABC transporter permease [Sphaerisporangium melleum]GGK93377.1 ABC transporter permease [Sphaerisporangium melleum]GII73419.1 ABC transporter permease [Sphaerisporangium melleum]
MTTQVVDGTAAGTPARGGARRPRGEGRAGRFLARHWYAWAMCAPVVVVTLVLIGYPLVRGVYLSLTDATEANMGRTIGMNTIPSTYEFVGLANYTAIVTSAEFLSRLAWTITWTVVCVALHYGLGLGLAMLLNRPLRLRSLYRMLLVLPWAVPAFVSAFIWRYLLNGEFGVVNAMLRAAGLPGVQWLDDPLWAKASVIAVNVWLGVPFMMLALLGGLQAIPRELYEAAEVDGATPWQRFRHITLPGLRPVSSTVVLLGTIWTFNQFPVIFLVTRGGPGGSSEILVTYAYRQAFEGIRNYSGSAAWGVLILVLLVVMAVVYRRALRRQGEAW